MFAERPVIDKSIDVAPIVHDQMRPLHIEIVEEMTHAIPAIERTAYKDDRRARS